MKVFRIIPLLLITSVFFNFSFFPFSFLQEKNNSSAIYSGTNYRIFPGPFLQVETSIHTHPLDSSVFAGAAITNYFAGGYTTGFYKSVNNGLNWSGTDRIMNSSGGTIISIGDPGMVITMNGNYIISYIALSPTSGSDFKAGASYSTNNGSTWSPTVYVPGVDTADKPFSVADNNPSSPYSGRAYLFFDEIKPQLEISDGVFFSYTTNGGVSWATSARITNIDTNFKSRLIADASIGKTGNIFLLWYTNRFNLGFAKSTNGGANWTIKNDNMISTDAARLKYAFGDIYLQGVPVMEVDKSGGPRDGWIYVVNSEYETDSLDLMIRHSSNGGVSFSSPVKVNQDVTLEFTVQAMPALNVDRYGGVNVFYYDARNSNENDSMEIFLSRSVDGGNTFDDIKISDHKFKMERPGDKLFSLEGYLGSYIGVASNKDNLVPMWFEKSTGIYQAWTTPVELLPTYNLKIIPEGLYNTSTAKLTLKDTLKVYLRNSASPYNVADSSESEIDSVTFNALFKFHYDLPQGNYYLELQHRNSIETWSAFPVTYSFGSKVNYDFTLTPGSAYGSNLKNVDGKWCLYSGDVNKDGIIDISDLISIYNAGNVFLSGYVNQDCNGDSFVDLSDLVLAYNNSVLFVTVIRP